MRPIILITLDSCRLDSFVAAKTPFFDSLGTMMPARSHADYTIPSHHALFNGCLPHSFYWPGKRPFMGLDIAQEARKLGYSPVGAVSIPYLHKQFGFGKKWDRWIDTGDMDPVLIIDAPTILRLLGTDFTATPFIFLNLGETHFPYCHPDRREAAWSDQIANMIWHWSEKDPRFQLDHINPSLFREMHDSQIDSLEWLDRFFGEWDAPDDAVWIITADHGELFGEHHLVGHGHGCYEEEIAVPILSNDWDYLYRFMGGPK